MKKGTLTINKQYFTTHNILHSIAGCILLFLMAQVNIPLTPVPITLQTVGVMIIGLIFSYRNALNSTILYVSLGIAGFPLFMKLNSGMGYFLGPTGGYLVGFILAAATMAKIREYLVQEKLMHLILICFLGNCIIYIIGVSWLAIFLGDFKIAIFTGVFPFIIPGLIKIIVLSLIIYFLKNHK